MPFEPEGRSHFEKKNGTTYGKIAGPDFGFQRFLASSSANKRTAMCRTIHDQRNHSKLGNTRVGDICRKSHPSSDSMANE